MEESQPTHGKRQMDKEKNTEGRENRGTDKVSERGRSNGDSEAER